MNKRGHIKFCNLFWGNHLDYFCLKHRSMNHQFYFCGFQAKIIQSTTAITSIVIRLANQLQIKCESMNYPSLRDSATPNRSNPNKIKSARSANPHKSFCSVWLSPKVESPLLLNFNQPNKADSQNLTLDSASLLTMTENKKVAESTNKAQQTIEEIAVEVAEFLGDFERKTGLESAQCSKSPKSPQDAPKTKLQTRDELT